MGVKLGNTKARTWIGGIKQDTLLRIFGPNREEVAGGWRRLHHEVLHNLYASPNQGE